MPSKKQSGVTQVNPREQYKADLIKISHGALIAISGAILTAIASITVPELDINADTETLISVVVLSVIVNAVRKIAPKL